MAKKTLFEIDAALAELLEAAVDPETGEVMEEAWGKIDALQGERDAKIEGIALAFKNAKKWRDDYKALVDEYAKKVETQEEEMNYLKGLLTYALKGAKMKTAKVSVYYTSRDSVEVEDQTILPAEFFNDPKPPEPSKTKIAEAIKAGNEVPGARIVANTSTVIR